MEISGATVLLTGATGGIGNAIARRLRAAGAQLILTGRRSDALEPLAQECGARAIALDLSIADDVDRLIDEVGDVDILIANAALPATGTLDSFTLEELDRALDVNLRAPIVLSRAFAPGMIDRHRGQIVLISSLAGKAATPRSALYNASKFGLRGFASALRADLHPHGVGVSCVFPGFISDAGMFADSGANLPRGVGTRTPDDVARAVATAVQRNRAEIDVAPLFMRVGATLAGIAPELYASFTRRAGAEATSEEVAAGQLDKR